MLHYTARLRGIALLDVAFCLHVDSGAYRAQLVAHTLGLADFLVHGRVEGRGAGRVEGTRLLPMSYTEHGRVYGEDFALAIDYPDGNPVVRNMSPPAEKYRTPVPQTDTAGAIDGLSAIALEVLVVSRTGACQGGATVFDGRQVRRLATHTAGRENLAPSPRSVFAGQALRCDTESRMLSGFLKDQSEARQARPHFSKAWLAQMHPGGDFVPVRFAFDADLLGDITVDLDRSTTCTAPS